MEIEMKALSLKSSKPVVGFGVCLGSERSAEMVSQTGFDYIMIDLLHSHFDKTGAANAIRSIAKTKGPSPIARVADNTPGNINSFLDAGAMGIIIPMVESAQEAEQAVLSTFYPPLGKRSKGSLGSEFYGKDYFKKFNELASLIVMIETPEAALNAEKILSVPGITGCLIGSGDLSYILKRTNHLDELNAVVHSVILAGKKVGIPIGLSVSSTEEMKYWWNEGVDFFLVSHDMGILSAAIKTHEKKYLEINVKERNTR